MSKSNDKPTVFICYAREDEEWKNLLLPHLGALVQQDHIRVWHDGMIDDGEDWYPQIEAAIERAAVAICLISADFLDSGFIMKEEVPLLLKRRQYHGMWLLPVYVRPCAWKVVEWLTKIQMYPDPERSLADLKDEVKVERALAHVAERVFARIKDTSAPVQEHLRSKWAELPEEHISLEHRPRTRGPLLGRKDELQLLDEAWESQSTRLVSFVAWGGVGKSALINEWTDRMGADNFRGAERVYAWTFYSQGTGERVTSADLFISKALAWFGDPDPKEGSPWKKGRRLADLIRRQRTLLLLDGIEPLQSTYELDKGAISDPALAVLVAELGKDNPGLCVITSREELPDLPLESGGARQEDLAQISPQDGRALLRINGVRGTDEDLEQAVRDFGCHALAVRLLPAYVKQFPGHRILSASDIPDLDVPEEKGKHPRRVMAALAGRLGEGPELQLLRVMGLFDRPAKDQVLRYLRADERPVPGLTDQLVLLSGQEWLSVVDTLREAGLIAGQSEHAPLDLDAHPLVREHFGEELRAADLEAWKEGHSRIFDCLRTTTERLPDTLAEMEPLFRAVAHGCQAGRHQEALVEVYHPRISRGNEAFVLHKLGAFGAGLAALSGFFEVPWSRPVGRLIDRHKAFVLNAAGFILRGLGRMREAREPIAGGLEADVTREDWANAAIAAGNLSQVTLTLGEVAAAVDYGRKGMELAERSGDASSRESARSTLAHALHQSGNLPAAEELFREAEGLQQKRHPEHPFLYSLRGYQFCDLLLAQGRFAQVQERANKTLKWVKEDPRAPLLTVAVDYLSLGRATLLQAELEDSGVLQEAARHLNEAVRALREADLQEFLALGLLARAGLYRVTSAFTDAWDDLTEAREIAERGEMKLHLADFHLEAARLSLAEGKKDQAREDLATAGEMIEEMGYGRRKGEAEELEISDQ